MNQEKSTVTGKKEKKGRLDDSVTNMPKEA